MTARHMAIHVDVVLTLEILIKYQLVYSADYSIFYHSSSNY